MTTDASASERRQTRRPPMTEEEKAALRAQPIKLAERRAQALALRRSGATYADIARALGVSLKTANRDVTTAIEGIVREPAEHVRLLELDRLDRLFMAHYQYAIGRDGGEPDVKHTEVALRIMDRRARYLGIDAPKKFDFTAWVRNWANERGLDPDLALTAAGDIVDAMGF